MLEDTLVVWLGKFGRSPKFNAAGGRDHWGQIIGATVYHCLGFQADTMLRDPFSRPLAISTGKPIQAMM